MLNGLAVAKMHQKDYDEAQKRLQEVRGGVVALRGLRAIVMIAPMARELDAVEQTPRRVRWRGSSTPSSRRRDM